MILKYEYATPGLVLIQFMLQINRVTILVRLTTNISIYIIISFPRSLMTSSASIIFIISVLLMADKRFIFYRLWRRITQKILFHRHLLIFVVFIFIKTADDFFTTIDNVLDARIESVLGSQQNTNSSSRYIRRDFRTRYQFNNCFIKIA